MFLIQINEDGSVTTEGQETTNSCILRPDSTIALSPALKNGYPTLVLA